MNKAVLFVIIIIITSCKEQKIQTEVLTRFQRQYQSFDSSDARKKLGWRLGKKTRELLETPYEGLPFNEPQFTLKVLAS